MADATATQLVARAQHKDMSTLVATVKPMLGARVSRSRPGPGVSPSEGKWPSKLQWQRPRDQQPVGEEAEGVMGCRCR